MKKRKYLFLSAALLALSLCAALQVGAQQLNETTAPTEATVPEETAAPTEATVPEETAAPTDPTQPAEPDSLIRGTCGSNISWTLDLQTGILTVSGTGEMGERTWGKYTDKVTQVVVEEGITTLCSSAFKDFTKLRTVDLPESLHTVGARAFWNTQALKEITLPASVRQLGTEAFYDSAIGGIAIPAGVTQVSGYVFYGCTGLAWVELPEGLRTIGNYAFYGCTKLTKLEMPDTVTTLGALAFSGCTALKEVRLSAGLKELPNHGFSDCNALTRVEIPDSVETVEQWCFSNCKSLQQVHFGAGLFRVETDAFNGCKALKTFTVSSDNQSLRVVDGVLYTKDKARLLIVPPAFTGKLMVADGTKIIDSSAATYREGITEVVLPSSVKEIWGKAFYRCGNLEKLTMKKGLQLVDVHAFAYCDLKELSFPSGLQMLKYGSFADNKNLTKVIFRGMAPSVDVDAFDDVEAVIYYPEDQPGWKEVTHWFPGCDFEPYTGSIGSVSDSDSQPDAPKPTQPDAPKPTQPAQTQSDPTEQTDLTQVPTEQTEPGRMPTEHTAPGDREKPSDQDQSPAGDNLLWIGLLLAALSAMTVGVLSLLKKKGIV
jgi:hypothetical protein